MNEPQHRMIALTGGEVHVLDWGGGGPAVHFAHANGFNGATYAPILAPLAGEARLLASDLRGHGFTTLPADPAAHPGWPVFAADLAALLAAMGAGPYVLAGHSMGATSSLLAAALRPDLVRALVLFDPVAANFPPDIDRESLPLVAGARKRRAVFPDAAAALAAYIGRGAFKTWPDETIAAYLKGGLKPDPEGVRLACDPLWEAANFIMGPAGVLEAIDAVRCPIAVFTAGEGSTTGAEALERLRDRRPDSRIERVAGTTHFLPMERPDLVRAAIREALSAR